MWDLIVSVPDHCLSFYFPKFRHWLPLVTIGTNGMPMDTNGFCLDCFGKQDIYWIGFGSGFGFYRRQISKRGTSGYMTFRALVEYSFVLLN